MNPKTAVQIPTNISPELIQAVRDCIEQRSKSGDGMMDICVPIAAYIDLVGLACYGWHNGGVTGQAKIAGLVHLTGLIQHAADFDPVIGTFLSAVFNSMAYGAGMNDQIPRNQSLEDIFEEVEKRVNEQQPARPCWFWRVLGRAYEWVRKGGRQS